MAYKWPTDGPSALPVQSLGASTFTAFAGTVDAQTPLNTATTNFFWVALG